MKINLTGCLLLINGPLTCTGINGKPEARITKVCIKCFSCDPRFNSRCRILGVDIDYLVHACEINADSSLKGKAISEYASFSLSQTNIFLFRVFFFVFQ